MLVDLLVLDLASVLAYQLAMIKFHDIDVLEY